MTRTPRLAVMMMGKTAVVEIYDDIGPSWLGMIDAKAVSRALQDAGPYDQIEVRINSVGGSAFEGIAIHNLLKADPAPVTVRVDGLAASAASIIAMAGDTVIMPASAMLMIHEPATFAFGGSAELRKAAEMLDKIIDSAATIYADKSGQTPEWAKEIMAAETWLNGDEAVELGLADRTEGEVEMVVELREPGQSFRNAPSQFHELVAMSARQSTPKGPKMPKAMPKGKTAPKQQATVTELVDEILDGETPAEETPTVETPAVEAGEGTGEASGTPAPTPAPVDQRAEIKTYMAAFGDSQGAQWYVEGKSYADCQQAFTEQLKGRVAELETRLSGVQLGESEPLSGGGSDPESGRKPGETKEKSSLQLKLGDRLGSYAASLKMPTPSAN